MPIAAALPVIAAIAPIAGGLISSSGAQAAASTQASAENAATANTKSMFDTTVANEAPYNTVGQAATYSLADLYGLPTPTNPNGGQPFNAASDAAFTNSPDYQFAQQQGIAGLDASAASKGGLLSGNQLEAITNYSSGLATQNFNNYASRLQALGSQGEAAAGATGTASSNAAASEANTIVGAGNATAAGQAGSTNALTNGFNTGINNLIQANGGLGQSSSYSSGGDYGGAGSFGSGASGAPMMF